MKHQWIAAGIAVAAGAIIGCGSSTGEAAQAQQQSPAPPEIEQPGTPAIETTETASVGSNFSLLSTNGGVVNFADLRGTVPIAVFFYGGRNCIGCEDHLRLMQRSYNRFKQAGAELLAISTDLPEKNRMTAELIGAQFPVLSDVDASVSQRWGVFNLLGNGHSAPALFVFDSSGAEIARRIGTSASELPGMDEVLQAIQRSINSATAAPTPTPRSMPESAATPGATVANGVVLGPGVTDFQLPDAIGGGEITLSETLKDRNVVLVFYRAFW